MSKLIELTDSDFTKEVKLSEKPVVLVEFYAKWSEASDLHIPILEELAEEYDYVKLCRIDVDAAPRMSARYGVVSVPTVMVFHQAQIVNIQTGPQSKENLANMIM